MDRRSSEGSLRAGGFSLVELMTVIAILSLLLGLSALSVRGSLDNYRLSATAAQLQADLSYASQRASRDNASVYFRFYRDAKGSADGGESYLDAYQMLRLDQETGNMVPLGNVKYFDAEIIVFPDPEFSNLLERGLSAAGESDPAIPAAAGMGELTTKDYEFCEIRLKPDGSTSLQTDRAWAITLALKRTAGEADPPNESRVLTINSTTSSVRIY